MAERIDDTVISPIRELLVRGRSADAVQRFRDLQQRGVLPRGRQVIPWIKRSFGPDLMKTLVLAFAQEACPFCTKGLTSCERCEGRGHVDYALLCDDCFGLGVRACQFCNGMGWASWDFIPEGLRLLVLAERTQAAVDSIRDRQEKATTATETQPFLRSVQTLLAINKNLGTLENTVGASDKARPHSAKEKKMLDAMVHGAVQEAAVAIRQRNLAVEEMIAALESLSQDVSLGEEKQQFEKDRMRFYRAACQARPPFEGTFLRHPLLEDTVRVSGNAGQAEGIAEPED